MITKRLANGRISIGSNKKHGMSKAPEYDCWIAMKSRCSNPAHPMFKHYGARGIKVCDAWMKSFELFIKDMGRRASPNLSIERINVNGNYEPSNCKWETMRRQQLNRRNSNICPGVHFEKSRKKWHADIVYKGKKIFLGRFDKHEDAALARKIAEKKYAF